MTLHDTLKCASCHKPVDRETGSICITCDEPVCEVCTESWHDGYGLREYCKICYEMDDDRLESEFADNDWEVANDR